MGMSRRIALRNALWDLESFFATHVFAIRTGCALCLDNATLLLAYYTRNRFASAAKKGLQDP